MKHLILPVLAVLVLVPASAHAMKNGTVKFFNESKGFGFIKQDGGFDTGNGPSSTDAGTIDLLNTNALSCNSVSEVGFPEFELAATEPVKVKISYDPPPAGQKLWLPANFKLSIGGLEIVSSKEVTQLEGIVVKQSTTTDDIGEARDLKKECSSSGELRLWRQTVINGKVERKSVSVCFHNDAAEESMRLNLFDCFPTKWVGPTLNAKNSGHASESIEFSCQNSKHDASMAAIQNTR